MNCMATICMLLRPWILVTCSPWFRVSVFAMLPPRLGFPWTTQPPGEYSICNKVSPSWVDRYGSIKANLNARYNITRCADYNRLHFAPRERCVIEAIDTKTAANFLGSSPICYIEMQGMRWYKNGGRYLPDSLQSVDGGAAGEVRVRLCRRIGDINTYARPLKYKSRCPVLITMIL